ncbi:MAG: MerR family transcriptional regulator [Anaerolineae bacterium]
MLRIGDFSKICQVSVKALRHWDSIGLLKPALSDAQTGYRYYSIEQVRTVNQVLAFRAMGLGLPQITQLLNENPTTADIRAMLHLKQTELRQQIEDAATMLEVVESRLQQIDHEGALPGYAVAVKSSEPQQLLAIRETVPTMDALVDLLQETYPYARQKGNTNLLAVFHDEGYEREQIDVEVGFPTDYGSNKPIPLGGGRHLLPTTLPGTELLAYTVHKGEWITLSNGYVHLGRWIESSGYEIVGPGREIFHHIDWENQQKNTVTELQFPVARRRQ